MYTVQCTQIITTFRLERFSLFSKGSHCNCKNPAEMLMVWEINQNINREGERRLQKHVTRGYFNISTLIHSFWTTFPTHKINSYLILFSCPISEFDISSRQKNAKNVKSKKNPQKIAKKCSGVRVGVSPGAEQNAIAFCLAGWHSWLPNITFISFQNISWSADQIYLYIPSIWGKNILDWSLYWLSWFPINFTVLKEFNWRASMMHC